MQYLEGGEGTDDRCQRQRIDLSCCFVAIIAVPIIASILTKKKKENSGKEKDKK